MSIHFGKEGAPFEKKVLIFLIVLGLLGAATVFDLVRSRMFTIELVSMTPNPAVADGQTLVEVSVRLLDYRGRPVQGHALYALARTGGMFRSPPADYGGGRYSPLHFLSHQGFRRGPVAGCRAGLCGRI